MYLTRIIFYYNKIQIEYIINTDETSHGELPVRGSGSSAAPGKSSNKSRLFEDLKHQILALQLGPDEDLDGPGLCERYGLSRTPVREVFRRLSGEGYVYIREHCGASRP